MKLLIGTYYVVLKTRFLPLGTYYVVLKTLFLPLFYSEDIVLSRLVLAQKLGANETVLVRTDETDSETLHKILAVFDDGTGEPDGPDVTIECSGDEGSIRLGLLVRFFFFFLLFILLLLILNQLPSQRLG